MLSVHLAGSLENLLGKYFKKRRYVVGVSGGLDSVSLLHAVCQVVPREHLTILHFNHLTRGKESNEEEHFVRSLAEKYGLSIVVERRKNEGLSEAALRKERLSFFRKEGQNRNAYVLLAHHLDDQLETFLFRLIRGTQLKGLMGMRNLNGRLLRPFLSIPKSELVAYAHGQKLEYREDSSNFSSRYFRNRIRHELTPVLLELAKSFGGEAAFYSRFRNLTQASHEMIEIQEEAYDALIQKCFVRTKFFDRLGLEGIPQTTLQSGHFIRRLFETVDTKKMSRTSIENVLALIKKGRGRTTFLGGFSAEISCGFLYFQSRSQRLLWEKGIGLRDEANVTVSDLISFQIPRVPGTDFRTFLPGDRFGKKKLKEEFLRCRIPRLERALVPLMLRRNTNDVIWFLGVSKNTPEGMRSDFPFAQRIL